MHYTYYIFVGVHGFVASIETVLRKRAVLLYFKDSQLDIAAYSH